MAQTSYMLPLQTPAPDFALPDLDGNVVSPDSSAGASALLVAFLCNHCPYVRHVEQVLGERAREWQGQGVAIVGICSNDVVSYPDDDRDGLAAQAKRAGFAFPYLVDESQAVARAYQAACTPDFFLFDQQRRLVYRGAMDASTPGNDVPVTGDELHAAVTSVLAGEPVSEPHRPSLGCSIKWKE
jgi:peroxiredoxin